MYPIDYENDFAIVKEEFDKDVNCIHAHLRTKQYAFKCEHCGSTDIKSIGWRKKDGFRDITNTGCSVGLTIDLRRYHCRNCEAKLKLSGMNSGKLTENGEPVQSTYTVGRLPSCVTAKAKISASIVDEIISLIVTKHMTVNDAAKELGVSPSSASEAIKRRRTNALKSIKAFQMPDILVVYPFNYGNKERCALIGIQGDRPMLFDILPNCKAETVQASLVNRDTNNKNPWPLSVTLTDFPRPCIHDFLKNRYQNHTPGILREFVLDEITTLRKKSFSRDLLAAIDDALADLDCILATHVYAPEQDKFISANELCEESLDSILGNSDLETKARESFEIMFHNWWDVLPIAVQRRLDKFYEKINTHCEEITTGFISIKPEHAPSKLLRFITVCRAHKISFDELPSWLALISGVHNREGITAQQMLSSSFVPQPIHDFYIDLNELNALLDE